MYLDLVSKDVVLARQVFKSRFHRALRSDDSNPQDLERIEVRRWNLRVAEFIVDAELPARLMQEVQDPARRGFDSVADAG